MTEPFYAHNLSGKPPTEWQRLEERLKNVAALAHCFAKEFGDNGTTSAPLVVVAR